MTTPPPGGFSFRKLVTYMSQKHGIASKPNIVLHIPGASIVAIYWAPSWAPLGRATLGHLPVTFRAFPRSPLGLLWGPFLGLLRPSLGPPFLGAKKRLYKRLRRSVGPLVGPHDAITWKTSYVAIASRRGGGRGKLVTSRFLRT